LKSADQPKTYDEVRLERACEGAKGILARVSRQVELRRGEKQTGTLVVSIKSHDGMLTAVVSSSSKVNIDAHGSDDVDEILLSVMDRLQELAHRGVNKTLVVEIIAREGVLTAHETIEEIYRWNG
jgi:hypothetical protein